MRSRVLESGPDQESDAVLGGGTAGATLREIDWSASPLGPVAEWPQDLKFAVRFMLASAMPMSIWWGRDFVQLCNEAFLSTLGGHALQMSGRPASIVWREVWDQIGPAAQAAMGNCQGVSIEAPPIIRDNNGVSREASYSFSFNPIVNDAGEADGLFVVAADDTKRAIDERQLALLRELATTSPAAAIAEVCETCARALSNDPRDLPFALIYLFDAGTQRMVLKGAAGVFAGEPAAPHSIGMDETSPWPLAKVMQERKSLLISDLADRLNPPPTSVWQRPLRQAVLVPLRSAGHSGIFVAGLSPVRLYDDDYRGFVELVAARIAASIGQIGTGVGDRPQALADAGALTGPLEGWESIPHAGGALTLAAFRREAESALRESEQRYRQLVQALPAALYTTDAEGRLMLYNQAAVELWGRTPEVGIDLWCGSHRCVDADGAPLRPEDCPMAIAIKTGKPVYGQEFIIERPDGSRRHVLAHPQPIFDSSGKLIGAVNMLVDITERRDSEAALQKNLEWLRRATQTGKVGIWDWNVVENRVTWTDSLYAMHGIKSEEFAGTLEGFANLVHAEDRAAVDAAIRATLERNEPYAIEFRASRPDGRLVWLYTNGVAVRESGRVARMIGVTVDITEGKLAAESLRKRGDRLHLLWEMAAVLLTVEDSDAMLDGLFDRIASQFGLDVYVNYTVTEEGDALQLGACAGIPDDVKPLIRRLAFGEGLCGLAASSRTPVIATHIHESNDPKLQIAKSLGIRAYVCKPMIAGARLLGTLSFGSRTRDEFEPDEVEFLRTVTRYVTVAYERLRLMNELKQADQRKDEFLATLAHELRNPLAPLRNGLQILQHAQSGPAENDPLAMMERQLDQMVRLIDDLLDVSRISRGKIELRPERVDLAEVIRSAVEAAGPMIAESGNMLFENVPVEPILVHGDFARLTQVLANLLTNAAKYTPSGGRIELIADSRDGWVSLSVRDNGIGIPAHMLPRVFDMFMQVDSSLEKAQGGLGIGLTIVKRLVEMHHGTVEARSGGSGMGSEFVIRLPAAAPASRDVDDSEPAAHFTPSRILIVDDNKDAARSMATLLSLDGHETRAAFDGFEAFDIAADFRPDMILMDIGMPKLNGHDACRRIREQDWGKNIVMVALTGWGQEDDRRQSYEVGFDHHLVKPIKVSAIHGLLSPCEASRS